MPDIDRLPPVLTGKKALVVGVANDRSIAWGCAAAMRKAGAEIAMTYLSERAKPHVEPLALQVEAPIFMPLEVRDPAQVDAVFDAVAKLWGQDRHPGPFNRLRAQGGVAGPRGGLSRDGFLSAMDVSCWSFLDMARRAEALMKDGGTMLTMSYLGANAVVDNYGIMGPVKAALEIRCATLRRSSDRRASAYAVSPGPLATRAASGIKDFDDLMERVSSRAPARRLVTIEEVGAASVFLASDYGAAMTGETLYIDGGYHILA